MKVSQSVRELQPTGCDQEVLSRKHERLIDDLKVSLDERDAEIIRLNMYLGDQQVKQRIHSRENSRRKSSVLQQLYPNPNEKTGSFAELQNESTPQPNGRVVSYSNDNLTNIETSNRVQDSPWSASRPLQKSDLEPQTPKKLTCEIETQTDLNISEMEAREAKLMTKLAKIERQLTAENEANDEL